MSVTQWLSRRGKVAPMTGAPLTLKHVSRNDLPQLARDLQFTRGAEIGVWKGAYSAQFCDASPSLHMLCVDPWQSYPAWLDTKNSLPKPQAEQLMTEAHSIATTRLAPRNCTIVRKFSVDAAAAVKDRSLDFAYIDGNHVFTAVLEDLAAWMPKIRPGGFLGGHDFRVFPNKPTIHVIAAVNAFTQERGIAPWFVLAADRTPSFLWEVN